MILLDLQPGTRFEILDSGGPLRGTLLKVTECRAFVEFDANATPFSYHPPSVRDFETADHQWKRIENNGKRRTSISPQCRVRVIR